MLSVKKFVEHNIDKLSMKTMKTWYAGFVNIVRKLTDYEFMLAVYTLRVYVPYDYDYECLKTRSVTKEKLDVIYRKASKKKLSEKMLSPEFIIDFLIREIKEIIYLMPIQMTSDDLPKLSIPVQNEIINSIDGLESNIRASAVNKNIPEQSLYIWTRNIFMGFWLLVIIPFIAYNSVERYLPLFGSVVQLMLLIPLINAWYVGKPFVHSGHYSGPNYFKWRRDVYKTIEYDKDEREESIREMKSWINGVINDRNVRLMVGA